ncbi:MAG TPA: hypothetical protein VH187_23230 [Scandinavium sp.]|uniref:hypothetical protein n=1 Tax=Scandinavium sp. TaxID=2830653 RepID=UPI002E3312C7|nr:hypothetical protein [Scandinavium sp.]HEX4504043.1 hypothetical protein [Scandinavium sp.]
MVTNVQVAVISEQLQLGKLPDTAFGEGDLVIVVVTIIGISPAPVLDVGEIIRLVILLHTG